MPGADKLSWAPVSRGALDMASTPLQTAICTQAYTSASRGCTTVAGATGTREQGRRTAASAVCSLMNEFVPWRSACGMLTTGENASVPFVSATCSTASAV